MSTTLQVDDMSCDGCEDIVETALEEVSGVESAEADHEAGTAIVEGNAEHTALTDAVDHAGYSAEVAEDAAGSTSGEDETSDEE